MSSLSPRNFYTPTLKEYMKQYNERRASKSKHKDNEKDTKAQGNLEELFHDKIAQVNYIIKMRIKEDAVRERMKQKIDELSKIFNKVVGKQRLSTEELPSPIDNRLVPTSDSFKEGLKFTLSKIPEVNEKSIVEASKAQKQSQDKFNKHEGESPGRQSILKRRTRRKYKNMSPEVSESKPKNA